jgi:FAD-dependent urate hydroxylase
VDICVVGGGIGGLALARGLLADGHGVAVLERSEGPSTGGAAVTIFCNGAAAADGLGVRFDDLGGDIHDLSMRRSSGRPLMRISLEPMRRATGFAVRTVPRADLVRRLADGLGRDTIRYRSPARSVRHDGTTPVVGLEDGSRVCPDVVVGADGHRSVTRDGALADGPPRDAGWATWQGLSPIVPEVSGGTTGYLIVGPSGLVGLMPAGNDMTQWWFDAPAVPDRPLSRDAYAWLADEFGAYAEPVPTLLAAITPNEVGYFPHVVRDPEAPWGRGAVTLVGDAAHVFPPSQAQGANQALEDAWLLRRVLARLSSGHDDAGAVPAALRRYERTRAGRIRLISRMAASERTNRPPGVVLGLLARSFPPALAGRAQLRLLRRISSVLRDDA